MTAGDKNRKDDKQDDDRLMGEWMKVMLEEMERKRDEHDEALAEDRLRSGGGSQKPAAAKRKSSKRK
jgi:hypothetical protein